jgi:hypothetical protein
MSDERKVETSMRDLLMAAARFMDAAQNVYREQRPDDHAAMCTVVEHAGGSPTVTITLGADCRVKAGITHAGQLHPFFDWPGGKPHGTGH